jgi:hypothetical protein
VSKVGPSYVNKIVFVGIIVGRGGCRALVACWVTILIWTVNTVNSLWHWVGSNVFQWLAFVLTVMNLQTLLHQKIYEVNSNNYEVFSKDLLWLLIYWYHFVCFPGSASRSWCLACMLLVLLTLTGIGVVLPLTTRLRHGFHNFDYLSAVRSMLREVPLVDGWVRNLALLMALKKDWLIIGRLDEIMIDS